MSPMNGMSAISGRWTIGIRSTSGVAGGADQRPVGERRHAQREDVDRGAGDDLVRRQVDREERVDQGRQPARRHRREQADLPRQRLRRDPEAPEAAHQHHALDGDVDDARALRQDAAEAAQHERRREPQRRREQAGRDDVRGRWRCRCSRTARREMPPTAAANSARPPSRASPPRIASAPSSSAAQRQHHRHEDRVDQDRRDDEQDRQGRRTPCPPGRAAWARTCGHRWAPRRRRTARSRRLPGGRRRRAGIEVQRPFLLRPRPEQPAAAGPRRRRTGSRRPG